MKRQELFEKWIEALESGEYKQGIGQLTDERMKEWCCLGVACDVARKNGLRILEDYEIINNSYLPPKIARLFGIEETGDFIKNVEYRGRYFGSLAQMNDAGLRFKTIARIIRENFLKRNFEKF